MFIRYSQNLKSVESLIERSDDIEGTDQLTNEKIWMRHQPERKRLALRCHS